MGFCKVFLIPFMFLVVPWFVADASAKCRIPVIYNFGDSNSDTGGRSAALKEPHLPNGKSFFGKRFGRFCDGRLIIDFIAEQLGLPYLTAYLDSNRKTKFKHGANFAVGGASIRKGGYSHFHLSIQIAQFIRFKSRTIARHKKSRGSFRGQNDFSKALYTIDIGQNDLAKGFQYHKEEHVRRMIPDILEQLSQSIHKLYNEGARYFWVHNTGPIGCIPYNVIYYHYKKGHLDRNGCVEPQNKVAREFNRQLKERVARFNLKLNNSAFTYVDVYAAKYALVNNAKNLGFDDPMKFCCGSYYGYHVKCGKRAIVNGTEYGKPCDDPWRHISWDGIHYSQAANLWVSNKILNSSSLSESCHKHDIRSK